MCQSANAKFETMLYEYEDTNKKWQGRGYSSQKNGVIVPSKVDGDGLADCSDIIMMVQYKESSFLPLETLESLNDQDMLNVVANVDHNFVRKKQDVYQQNQTVLRHSGDNYYNQQMQKNYYYPPQCANSEQIACNIEPTIFETTTYDYTNNASTTEPSKKKNNKTLVSVDAVCKSVKVTIPQTVKVKPPTSAHNKNPTKFYSCSICDKKFIKKASLNVHMSTHTNIRPYMCQTCSKSFTMQWELTGHQKIHTGVHKCQFCPKSFTVQSKLQRHERTHTNERPFTCKVEGCAKRFSDKRNLISHEATHSGARDFVCDVCSKSYRTKSHLNDHKRAHEKAAFKCEQCGVEYKWKASLLMHMRKHRGYLCLCCGKDCEKLCALVKHRKVCGNKKA